MTMDVEHELVRSMNGITTIVGGLSERLNMAEARLMVQKDDLRRMSNVISAQAADIAILQAKLDDDLFRMARLEQEFFLLRKNITGEPADTIGWELE